MKNSSYEVDEVFGISREIPLNYVERDDVDSRLRENLKRKKNITIFGSSKQGKTCLRKHCLQKDEYILVQCDNKWSLSDLNATILKRAGYEITQSKNVSLSGKAKMEAKLDVKVFSVSGGAERGDSEEIKYAPLELDTDDVNDIILALEQIQFSKYIVLEDFHYLKSDVQKEFAYELKAFHEASKLCFILVGVWLDENKMVIYNGDLTGRIIPINADSWSEEKLKEVIEKGARLLNVSFDDDFVSALITASSGNVYILQEACNRACKSAGVEQTQDKHVKICEGFTASSIVSEIIREQSGRYSTFLTQFSAGFQDTSLQMYKWLLYPIVTTDTTSLAKGLSYRAIKDKIQEVHPSGKALNPGNLTQALNSVSSLQQQKSIRPIILDYDESNKKLHVVDKGFLIWLEYQDREELLSQLEIEVSKEKELVS